MDAWKERGPIHTFSARLKGLGLFTEAEFLRIDDVVAAEVEAAVAFAEAGTCEAPEDLLRDVLTPVAAAKEN
ncbi:hypothetical protein [Rhodococcus qingshengii]|uniref:hypothetical protein n=1 Tax=Rhodococcus qingshengii TaxID=334542 RepID=UPI0021AB6A00|nr:hypothetical protein [Rhodococcus qingshengii]